MTKKFKKFKNGTNGTEEEGNTDQPLPPEKGEKKRMSPSNSWQMTYFNEDFVKVENLAQVFNDLLRWGYDKVVVCYELAPDTGRPHYHAFIHYDDSEHRIRANERHRKQYPTAHWEQCGGDEWSNFNYAAKDSVYMSTFALPQPLKQLVKKEEWHPWQRWIDMVIQAEPHPRWIYWIYDPVGEAGKSTWTIQYRRDHRDTILELSGRPHDAKHVVAKAVKLMNIRVIFFDLPYDFNMEDFNYTTMEQFKNGAFLSGKFDSMYVDYNKPHMFIFSNNLPKKLTKNKLQVYEIKSDMSIVKREEYD